ncbi:MAG TPA: type II toxin-antitoxin system VapC family toxin [Anaerolineae bacterium]|nr:type II toxin-antitoxin system VapC family toxin [Anaerolineae bacterium]
MDTNIIIYFFKDEFPDEKTKWITDVFQTSFNVSVIAQIEFLGWNGFTPLQYKQACQFLDNANIISLDEEIAGKAIQLMREQRIKLPDAVIAATSIINNFTLVTRNIKDFISIEGLHVYNPVNGDSRSV